MEVIVLWLATRKNERRIETKRPICERQHDRTKEGTRRGKSGMIQSHKNTLHENAIETK